MGPGWRSMGGRSGPRTTFCPRPSAGATIPTAPGDLAGLVQALAAAGVDGVFTDAPRETVAALRLVS